MTGRCQLCGVTVVGRYVPRDEEVNGAMLAYDSLSALMWLHISENHPRQLQEGILCQQRAAKMYAMNWADTGKELEPVKLQWRQNMLVRLSVTTMAAEDQTAVAGGSTSEPSGTSEPSPSGANEKKESRKDVI